MAPLNVRSVHRKRSDRLFSPPQTIGSPILAAGIMDWAEIPPRQRIHGLCAQRPIGAGMLDFTAAAADPGSS
jgi:hypothetical protein